MSENETFSAWAIVDQLGHNRFVGYVSEEVIAGQGFVRVDVPPTKNIDEWTKLIGTSTIYSITPVTEEVARAMAEKNAARPIQPYELSENLLRQIQSRELDEDISVFTFCSHGISEHGTPWILKCPRPKT